VQVLHPDDYLRPEMNASVAFLGDQKAEQPGVPQEALVLIPASAVHDNSVFVIVDSRAVKKQVTVAATTADGVEVRSGLIGGEDLIVNPPADLREGQKVRSKQV